VNQGVSVELHTTDGIVALDDRNAPLLKDRMTLLQVLFTLEEGWEPRNIQAVLHVLPPGADAITAKSDLMVELESGEAFLDRSFYWILPPEMAVPETEYYVELIETEDGFVDDPATSDFPRAPASGSQPIGWEDREPVIDVVLVPLRDPSCAPDPFAIPQENIDAIEKTLIELHPVHSANITMHDEVEVDFGGNLGGGLGPLSDLKANEGLDDKTLVFGVVDGCNLDANTSCTATALSGISLGNIAVNGNTNAGIDFCAGRSMDLRGADCPNSVQGDIDPDYPYEDGKIGNPGFSVMDTVFYRGDTHYSCQSYCEPCWVSDYEWNKVLAWLEG
jgi:hypothetical protein